ncbi:hypothetical protein G6F56_004373 [Rhizopus delemar]|nr:hypothetical protein G6F56_004373 [Rhizopus delemar]
MFIFSLGSNEEVFVVLGASSISSDGVVSAGCSTVEYLLVSVPRGVAMGLGRGNVDIKTTKCFPLFEDFKRQSASKSKQPWQGLKAILALTNAYGRVVTFMFYNMGVVTFPLAVVMVDIARNNEGAVDDERLGRYKDDKVLPSVRGF